MTIYIGGNRERVISDSLFSLVNTILSDLGWFDAGRQHLPINVVAKEIEPDEEVPLNTLAITEAPTSDTEAELGSNFGEVRTTYYCDFYGENRTIAKMVAHDLRDAFKGRISTIGRSAAVLPVYDYFVATPTIIFYCDLEDVTVDPARGFPHSWQKNWYVVRLDVVDNYGDITEDD